jgi:hypothetical protein
MRLFTPYRTHGRPTRSDTSGSDATRGDDVCAVSAPPASTALYIRHLLVPLCVWGQARTVQALRYEGDPTRSAYSRMGRAGCRAHGRQPRPSRRPCRSLVASASTPHRVLPAPFSSPGSRLTGPHTVAPNRCVYVLERQIPGILPVGSRRKADTRVTREGGRKLGGAFYPELHTRSHTWSHTGCVHARFTTRSCRVHGSRCVPAPNADDGSRGIMTASVREPGVTMRELKDRRRLEEIVIGPVPVDSATLMVGDPLYVDSDWVRLSEGEPDGVTFAGGIGMAGRSDTNSRVIGENLRQRGIGLSGPTRLARRSLHGPLKPRA